MPSLTELAGIPFYSAYKATTQQNQAQGLQDLQEAGAVMQLKDKLLAHRRDAEMRQLLEQSGGNVEKAMAAAIQSGNIVGASKLAPIIEAQRKTNAPRVMTPGSQLLGPNNEVLHTVPPVPRTDTQPEIVKLQAVLSALPMDAPARPLIEQRIKYLAHGEQQGPRPFGAGATGGAMQLMTELAPLYAEGRTTPEQDRNFDMAVAHYTQPRQYMDPDSGLAVTRKPELPQFVQEAINRRRAAGARPQPAPEPPQPGPVPTPKPETPPNGTAAPFKGRTLWELAPLITGPVRAAQEYIGRTPLIGDMMQSPDVVQARNYVLQQNRDLIRVLQNNPRYSEGERRAIEKEISIDPRLFDNTTAYRDRTAGIRDALQVRLQNMEQTANNPNVGREERIHAKNSVAALRQYIPGMGVPPRVHDDSDWQALPSGTEYIAPDGRVKRKK